MPSRSNRAPSVPQRSSPRRSHHPTVLTESSHQRGRKRPLPSTNGLDHEMQRKSSRLQRSPDSGVKKHNQSTSDVTYQGHQKKAHGFKYGEANAAMEQRENVEQIKESQGPMTNVLERLLRQRGSQKLGNVNGDLPNLSQTTDAKVLVSTNDGGKGLMHQESEKQVDGAKCDNKSDRVKLRKNSGLQVEKGKECNFQTTSSDRRYPLRQGHDEDCSPSRQRYPVRQRSSSQGHSESEKNCSSYSGVEKKEELKGSKETPEVPCPESISKEWSPLIQWLPSPVVIEVEFKGRVYKCLKCVLDFHSLKSLITHCIPTSKVTCYICGDVSDCTCKERIHYLTDHQFICLYCHERFATQEAAKQHRSIIHPEKAEKSSPERLLTFHGKPPIDVSKQDNPLNTYYIVVLGRMKSVIKRSMPWIFEVKDSDDQILRKSIDIGYRRFLYRMNEAQISETARKKPLMCPFCPKGLADFDTFEEHMVDVHRPSSIQECKALVQGAKLPITTASTSLHLETIPVSSSSSSCMMGSETTQSAFCHQCQRVFYDKTSLRRHNVIMHSLSTVHKQALAQKAREIVDYNVTDHMCKVCKVPFTSEKSLKRHMTYSQHRVIETLPYVDKSTQQHPTLSSSPSVQGIFSGNASNSFPVKEKRLNDSDGGHINASMGATSSYVYQENTGRVLHRPHEMCQSQCQMKGTANASKKESKDALDSSQSKTKDDSSSKTNDSKKMHPSVVKSRKVDNPTSTASWYLPDALYTPLAINNAPAPVIQEVDMLIKDAMDILGVEKQVSLRSPYATSDRYKFSRSTAAYLMLKPVLQNPPQTPTARRNYEFDHKYKIPMGHLNPEFADCPLFPTLTDIFRRTKGYTMSPLRILAPQEIKKSVPKSSKSRGKIAKRFSKALESAFMTQTLVSIAKASRGHANVVRASNIQAHSFLCVKVSDHVNERINKAVLQESQHRSESLGINTGYLTMDPNQASASRTPVMSNGMPMRNHQEHGTYAVGARNPGPYNVVRGTPLQGQGLFPNVGSNLSQQGRYFEMSVGNNRALFSVNAQGLATVVSLIPGPRNAAPVASAPRTLPPSYNRGSVFPPHAAAHGATSSLNPQVPVPSNPHISNPVNAHVTNSVHPLAVPGQRLPVVTSYLAPKNRSILPAQGVSHLHRRYPYVDLINAPKHGTDTVKDQLERKRAAQQGVQQSSKAQETMVSAQGMTSVSKAVSNTTIGQSDKNRTIDDVMSELEQLATYSDGSKKSQKVPKEDEADVKKPQQPPVQGPPPDPKKMKRVILVPSTKGKKVTGNTILKRNAGKRVVQIKKKRLPASDWCVKQLHTRMQQESLLKKKNLWLHKKYQRNFVPTKETKPVAISTNGVFCKAGSVDTVLTVSEAVKRAKRAKICLDDFEDLCEKFDLYRSSKS